MGKTSKKESKDPLKVKSKAEKKASKDKKDKKNDVKKDKVEVSKAKKRPSALRPAEEPSKKVKVSKDEGKKVASKEKDTKGKTAAPVTSKVCPQESVPTRRVSFKSKPETIPSSSPETPKKELFAVSDTASGTCSPAVSLSSLQAWKKDAEDRGLSLAQYMEEISQQALEKDLEDQMKDLAKNLEVKEKAETGADGSSSSSEASASSSDGEEEGQDDEDDDSGNESINLESLEGNSEEGSEGDQEDEGEMDVLVASEKADEAAQKEKAEKAEKDKKVQEVDKDTDGKTAVVLAAEEQKAVTPPLDKDFSQANSKSHKPEWDRFTRQCLDRKKFPVALAPYFVKDKTDLFRQWLQHGGDWSQVEVTFKRKAEKKTTNRKEREGVKARDLYQKYPKEKADALMASLKSRGLWYYDPDFDKDEEEIYYYANCGNKLRAEDITSESASVLAKEVGNKELTEALIASDGLLGSGFQPEVKTNSEEGQRALLEALTAETEKRKAPQEKKEKTEKAKPETLEEISVAKMEECLKKGAEGRKFAIALQAIEYSGDLANQLMNFSAKMEKIFHHLQDLRKRKVTEESAYAKHFKTIEEKLSWYEKAEAAAKALQSGLGNKPKKGKGKKAKNKDKDGTDSAKQTEKN